MGMLRGRNMDKTPFTPILLCAASACLLSLTRYCPANGSLGNPVSSPLDLTRIPLHGGKNAGHASCRLAPWPRLDKVREENSSTDVNYSPFSPTRVDTDVAAFAIVLWSKCFHLFRVHRGGKKKKGKTTPKFVREYLCDGTPSCSLSCLCY
jgi:hypothetical protein